MSATVIAFPQRRPQGADDYGWMVEASRRFALESKIKGSPAEAAPVKTEADYRKELVALLRRIDRRLAKMAGPGGLAEGRAAAG